MKWWRSLRACGTGEADVPGRIGFIAIGLTPDKRFILQLMRAPADGGPGEPIILSLTEAVDLATSIIDIVADADKPVSQRDQGVH